MMNEPFSETRPDLPETQAGGAVTPPAPASESARSVSARPAPAGPRRGRMLISLTAMLVAGLICGAIGGGIAGSLVAQKALQAQVTPGMARSNSVPVVAPAPNVQQVT